ncbi:MAG: LexA family transcriptional regulator [Bacteroidota bacterium]
MKELGEKLRAIREALQLNQAAIASRIGRQQRDISDLEQGKRKAVPTEYIHFLIGEGLDLNWLFSQEPLRSPDPYLLQYQRQRESGQIPTPGSNQPRTRMVPRHLMEEYPRRHGELVFQRMLPTVELPGPELSGNPEDIRGFQMADDSMQDTLAPYDWVISRRNTTPLHQLPAGYVYIVVTHHQVIVGRLGQHRNGAEGLRMVFEQDAYPPLLIEEREVVEVWRGMARLSVTLTGSKKGMMRQLEGIHASLEDIRDRLPKNN